MSQDIQNKITQIQRSGEERDAQNRASKLGLPYVDFRKIPVSLEAIKIIPEKDARQAKLVAIQVRFRDVAIAGLNPNSPESEGLIKNIESQDYKIKRFVCSQSSLIEAWRMYEFVSVAHQEIVGTLEITKDKIEELKLVAGNFGSLVKTFQEINYEDSSTTDVFRMIMVGALNSRASDIHLEAGEDVGKIRFRVDGILHDVANSVPNKNYEHLMSRLKLLSELKLNVRDEPQDGRFTIDVAGKELEIRVSIIPSEFGETVVMRVLDPAAISVSMPELGLRKDDLNIVENSLKKPNGLILNTGPTGSGKTTTLYAFLKRIVNPEIKVITVEDPIEYRLDGVEQTQVDSETNYTFASGLRSILRQDPDAILVGEVRDKETADVALQAALTGHLVFSTLHTNDAVGAIPRLVDLGVKTTTIGPALSLVIAQRLVRKLCVKCRKETKTVEDVKNKVSVFLNSLPERVDKTPYLKTIEDGIGLWEPVGCDVCNGFGYKGRLGIFEFLQTDYPEFEELITNSVSEVGLKKEAQKQGMVTIQQDGVLKAISGITTLEEVESVTGPIKWS